MQLHANRWHVVEYFSRKLIDTEQRYCATDKEFLAINEAVTKHWRHRLLDREFEILTDHNPLTGNVKIDSKHQESRRVRWLERLQSFAFKIRYVKGKENSLADGLSRSPEFCNRVRQLPGTFTRLVQALHEEGMHWGSRKIRGLLRGATPSQRLETNNLRDAGGVRDVPHSPRRTNLAATPMFAVASSTSRVH